MKAAGGNRERPSDPLLTKVEKAIEREDLLSPGDTVAVAVSGGCDSVALLQALCELSVRWRWRLAVLHVNHGLRGRESGQDARFVRRLAQKLGLPFLATKLRLTKAEKEAASEELLRRKRYDALEHLAGEAGTAIVALGHHRDDLAETVLMNFLRGSGPAGLAGFAPKARMGRITLVRPLYDCTRAEIVEFCRRRRLGWREDSSNRDMRWLRNRVRLELLPMLERTYNWRLRDLLVDNAFWFRQDERCLEGLAREALGLAGRRRKAPRSLPLDRLAALPVAVLARLFRIWVMAAGGATAPPSGRQIQELIRLVERGGRGCAEVRCSGDIAFFIRGGEIRWRKVVGRKQSVALTDLPDHRIELLAPGRPPQVRLPRGGVELPREGAAKICSKSGRAAMEVELRLYGRQAQPELFGAASARAQKATESDSLEQFFDADKIEGRLVLRNRRPGDRFHPLGTDGSRKLKDFLIGAKIASGARDRLLLLCDERKILWVVGLRICHEARLADTTEVILHVRLAPCA